MTSGKNFIGGEWIQGAGEAFASIDPACGKEVWQGNAAGENLVDRAVQAAREASEGWVELSIGDRMLILRRFRKRLKQHREELAESISREIGKPKWESLTEVEAMIGKIELTIDAFEERCATRMRHIGRAQGLTRYKPHGVVAVLGPFNFPGHLPNGHLVPALLAGNTVVFKPSELAPLVAEKMVELWESADLPAGVLNLVQGAAAEGIALSNHPGIDGLFFTGSSAVGKALSRTFAEHPGKILALEMGGNNPLIVHEVADLDDVAYETVLSAYITAGQRCTCARRLILIEGKGSRAFLDRLASWIDRVRVGAYTEEPEPFMGPVVSAHAAEQLLQAQSDMIDRGGEPIREMKRIGNCKAMLSPGLVDVTPIADREDRELFGPLLQVIWVADFEAALEEANCTRYGLAAGLFSDNRKLYDRFYRKIRAGIVNWNRQTTGASGFLPFGGIGDSGNHRPSGYFAIDYCAYPVGSIELRKVSFPESLLPGIQK